MFGGDDDFFGIFPDIDGDGDHDIVDFLILDEIDNEIQREIEAGESRTASFNLDEDDDDILLEYGIDRDDYVTREDYLEAVREAKYGWRDDVEDGSEYGLDPEDYETLEDYEEALEDARLFSSQSELLDDEDVDTDDEIDTDDSLSISIPLSFSIEVSYHGKDQLEEIKESDYPNKRTYDAAYALCEIEHGDPYIPSGTTKEAEAKRHKFVLSQSCIAARYLTRYDGFIFVQAVKDNFRLPIDVPNEDDEVKNYFPDFFMEVAEEDVNLALDVWVWCIKEFGGYQRYMDNAWTLYNQIMSSLDDYPEEFRDCLINRLGSDQNFRKGLLSECPDTPYCVPELMVRALTTNREKVAQVIFIAAMKNTKAKSKWKEDLLESIISECSNWEELESMEAVQKYILPIAEKIDDKRIQRVLPKMVKEVEDYIRSVESSEDKYQFSRRFAWRATCVDGSQYGISPLDYETEQEYLAAIEDRKYGWRKYLAPSKLRYANPQDYETAEEFHAAVREAFNKETKARAVSNHNANDRNVYKFCKIELEEEPRNTYYYFPGLLSLNIGDRVIVPLGRDNKEVYGTVVSVGECYGSALPCAVDNVKHVKSKA